MKVVLADEHLYGNRHGVLSSGSAELSRVLQPLHLQVSDLRFLRLVSELVSRCTAGTDE